jgi:hypothetical protein
MVPATVERSETLDFGIFDQVKAAARSVSKRRSWLRRRYITGDPGMGLLWVQAGPSRRASTKSQNYIVISITYKFVISFSMAHQPALASRASANA